MNLTSEREYTLLPDIYYDIAGLYALGEKG